MDLALTSQRLHEIVRRQLQRDQVLLHTVQHVLVSSLVQDLELVLLFDVSKLERRELCLILVATKVNRYALLLRRHLVNVFL